MNGEHQLLRLNIKAILPHRITPIGYSDKTAKVTDDKDNVISDYILDYNKNIFVETDIQFEAYKIYGAAKKSNEVIEVQIYALYEGFNQSTKEVEQSGSSLPVLIKLKKVDDTYQVVDHKEPADGADWVKSLKRIFPRKYV